MTLIFDELLERDFKHFLAFLKACDDEGDDGDSMPWHAIFKTGTVIRLDSLDEEFTSYEESSYEFPAHRLSESSDHETIMKENYATWERQKGLLQGDAGKAIRCAYKILIEDGYPYPGGYLADRNAYPILDTEDGPLWMVVMHDNLHLFNPIIAPDPMHAMVAGDYRRNDYMFPEVVAVVDPQLQVIHCTPAPAPAPATDPYLDT